jgi:hypothetical protein
VHLAARPADVHGSRLVRLISEPQDITARFVCLMPPGAARQLAAVLIVAAWQAEELDRNVSMPDRTRGTKGVTVLGMRG